MPEDYLTPAGKYKVRKRFRNLEIQRKKKDMPWSKKILDLDRHTLCERTAWGWARIIGFYLLLYFLIVVLLLLIILIFYLTFDGFKKPIWLKGAPGISIVPKKPSIVFNVNILSEIYPYADEMDNFMETLGSRAQRIFNDCNKDKLWGYRSKKPCIFIKLNKVIGYIPETYTTIEDLPKGKTPSALKKAMLMYPGSNRLWITCRATRGTTPIFNFVPGPYFDASKGLQNVDRVVALQMIDLPDNEEIYITCRIWAKNMDIDEMYAGWGNIRFYMHMFEA